MAAIVTDLSRKVGPKSTQPPAWVLGLVPHSEIAEFLATPQVHPGRAYAMYTLRNGAAILLPKRGAVRRAGLALYNPQMGTGLAAKGLMWTGIWPGRAVCLQPEPLEELRQVLADCIGNSDIELAFQFGATGIYSKAVVLVMDSAGIPLAYAKLAAIDTAQEALRHETDVLKRLSSDARLRGRISLVFADLEWNGFLLLVMSPGPPHRAPSTFGTAQRTFLACLASSTRTVAVLTTSPMWQEMNSLYAAWNSRLSSAWRRRYEWAFGELERRLGRVRLDLSLAHRDFAPWNTRLRSDGTLFVFDWEFARAGSTLGWDFFNFHVAVRAARAGTLDGDGVSELLAAARLEKIDAAEDFLLAYLTDKALFYHNAVLREGKDSHGCLEIAAQGIDTLRRRGF